MVIEVIEVVRGGRCGCGEKMQCLFEYGDLWVVLLVLFDKKFSYGYELIKVIEEVFLGLYVFSSGVIYLILILLEEQDFVILVVIGNGCKSY